MDETRAPRRRPLEGPAAWLLGGLAAAAAASLLLTVPDAGWNPRLQVGVMAAAAAADGAVGAVAWARYRTDRDPHMLFLAAGFAVLAVQAGLFGVWWPIEHGSAFTFGPATGASAPVSALSGPAPVYAWQFGWVVAGSCFVLGLPWWDRRGRPPIRPWRVLAVVAAVIFSVDLALATSFELPTTVAGRVGVDLGVPGPVLGLAAIAVLAAASVREVRRAEVAPHGRLATAFLIAVPAQVAVLAQPTEGLGFIQWADVIQLAVPALALSGLLASQRVESSRLRRAGDRAEEVMGGRAEIASMVAHEVRGPVSTIRGIAGTARSHYDRLSDDERREFLGLIEQEARRLMSTVDQTSLALKVDAGTLAFDIRPNHLATIVREGVDAAAVRDHPVTVDADPDVRLPLDRVRIAEVVRQLVENARKFSPPGTPIAVTARPDGGGGAAIEITDAGPGIPVGQRGRVFTKFPGWRPDGYEEQPGSGLGLFICKGLVAEHHGEITIEGGPAGGTMLRVRLGEGPQDG